MEPRRDTADLAIRSNGDGSMDVTLSLKLGNGVGQTSITIRVDNKDFSLSELQLMACEELVRNLNLTLGDYRRRAARRVDQ